MLGGDVVPFTRRGHIFFIDEGIALHCVIPLLFLVGLTTIAFAQRTVLGSVADSWRYKF